MPGLSASAVLLRIGSAELLAGCSFDGEGNRWPGIRSRPLEMFILTRVLGGSSFCLCLLQQTVGHCVESIINIHQASALSDDVAVELDWNRPSVE